VPPLSRRTFAIVRHRLAAVGPQSGMRRVDGMTRVLIFGAMLALALSACGGERSGVSLATESPDQAPAVTIAASPTVTLTAQPPTPSPTSAPTPAATPTALPTPTPFGAGVFAMPDSCTNPEAGYRVAYPEAWYSNAAMANPLNPDGEGIAACWLFAPTDFALVYGTQIPVEVAIFIRRFEPGTDVEWAYGLGDGARVLSSSEAAVAGLPAHFLEIEVTERSMALAPGDRIARYVVAVPDGSYLVAQTIYYGPDYEESKAVLGQMMETLELVRP
jgi:hypothetical protein